MQNFQLLNNIYLNYLFMIIIEKIKAFNFVRRCIIFSYEDDPCLTLSFIVDSSKIMSSFSSARII